MALLTLVILSAGFSHYSHGLSEFGNSANDPFSAKPDQIIFDYFPSPQEIKSHTDNQVSGPMLNSLFQGIDNREVCGDGKDNNQNGFVDENCGGYQKEPPLMITPTLPPPSGPSSENPKVEICGDNEDNDGNGQVDEGCDTPAPPLDVSVPKKFDSSKILRLAVFGDIDSNSGLTKQLDLVQGYNVQGLIIPGDFSYTSGSKVLSKLESYGFSKDNTDIAAGNHDSIETIKNWSGSNRTFGEVEFDFSGSKLALFNIDANTKFDCSSPQFQILKWQIESNDAGYKIAVVHQPFVTVQSYHRPNGQFDCYDPLFREAGIDAVLQAHNHNYQRFEIDNLLYGVYGTGTRDTGSGMYPIGSDDWNDYPCIKCITGQNGITLLDLRIDKKPKHLEGWFINLDDEVLDHFTK